MQERVIGHLFARSMPLAAIFPVFVARRYASTTAQSSLSPLSETLA